MYGLTYSLYHPEGLMLSWTSMINFSCANCDNELLYLCKSVCVTGLIGTVLVKVLFSGTHPYSVLVVVHGTLNTTAIYDRDKFDEDLDDFNDDILADDDTERPDDGDPEMRGEEEIIMGGKFKIRTPKFPREKYQQLNAGD